MRLVAAPAWACLAADVDDPVTYEVLARAFQALSPADPTEATPTVVATVGQSEAGLVEVTTARGAVRASSGDDAALIVSTAINLALLDLCPHLAVHAAVVATSEGALVMPGESAQGKSTLAAACVLAGFAYVSDEALVVLRDATVLPYPRPLGLSRWSRSALGLEVDAHDGPDEVLVDPFMLGQVAEVGDRIPVRAIVRMSRTGSLRLVELQRSEAVAELLRHSFNHYRDPSGAVGLAVELARGTQVVELELGDPLRAARLLARHFAP